MEDIQYAELLTHAGLNAEQLRGLSDLQLRWEADSTLAADVAAALVEVRDLVLGGMSTEEAYESLGERQQSVRMAQRTAEQALEQLCEEFAELLTEEQRAAISWLRSPVQALEGVVRMVTRMRGLSDEQWGQFRAQAVQGISRLCGQADPGAGTSPEQVGAVLDAARALKDAEFEAKRGALAREWATTLMPNLAKRLSDPEHQKRRLREVARHLITYAWGNPLVEARLAAGAGGDEGEPRQAADENEG
jgi:hypothetical protein